MPAQDPGQELQVRQTAQRLLADHLRCPPQTSGHDAQLLPPSPQQAFWPGIRLDLTGATLVDFTFAQVSVIQARLLGATFQGDAWFVGATFQGYAGFNRATFKRTALFGEATFQDTTGFAKATFQGRAQFAKATFQGNARFGEATFQKTASFDEATFQDTAEFEEATFQGYAFFYRATFKRTALFEEATFQDTTGFAKATFQDTAAFDGAHVHFDDLHRDRVWPDGWTVRADPTDPSRGTLVRAEHAKEPEPAVPPSDPTDDGSGTG